MYHMKNIVSLEQELFLPKCMYRLKNPIEECSNDKMDLHISDQVIKFLKKMPNNELIELESRQDKLLLKLEVLYERIRNISSLCEINTAKNSYDIINAEEIVLVLNPNNIPWFLNKFSKRNQSLNVAWHLHSSVPTEKIPKIEGFFRKYQDLYRVQHGAKVNLRLIFKNESNDPELKISSIAIPIRGAVNIIRYLCLTNVNIVPYDHCNHEIDALLDLCYQIETTTSEKNKVLLISKIFLHSKEWIYGDTFTIVDLATFNAIYQLQNGIKYVPKIWFTNCEKLIL